MLTTLLPGQGLFEPSEGIFIAFEGSEGGGKSTQVVRMREWFLERGYEVVVTKEPGGTPVAEKLRTILLTENDEDLTVECETLLLFAGRSQHITHVIKPAIEAGKVVICDRFIDSTYAYQVAGRGQDSKKIDALTEYVTKGLRPDITFLLDLPVEVGLQRAQNRGKLDRFEVSGTEFFERIRSGYLKLMERNAERYYLIDASGSIADTWAEIVKVLNKLYPDWGSVRNT